MVEIMINCAVIGEGSVISIIIEDWKTVALLKKAIKDEKPNKIKCDAKDLQLFLTKKGDGKWLDEAAAEAAALDWRGNSQGFEPMGPSLWLKNAKHFGENFQPGKDQVHVLVLVPEDEGDSGPASKKARHGYHCKFATAATNLMGRIRGCNCDAIFDIE
ncbi:hypothetical protein PR003_g32264, partial [Phytophthora rubi]